jgi:hypothetical protein
VRTLVGDDGRVWDVWPVRPQTDGSIGVRAEYAGGWLAFRSGAERLRFTPVPANWDVMTDRELLRCLAAAHAPDASRLSLLRSRVVPRG